MKAPTVHPLLDLPVALPDGRRGRVLRVYERCPVAPERCMVLIDDDGASKPLAIVPSADLKVGR